MQFCLCFSSPEAFKTNVYWYTFNPESEIENDNQLLPDDFCEGSSKETFDKISRLAVDRSSFASVGSKLYVFGDAYFLSSREVFCYDMCDKSLVTKEDMKAARNCPPLAVTNPPHYIYVVASSISNRNPDPFLEVYDAKMDSWLPRSVKSLPDPRAYVCGFDDATFVEIDGRKKLYVTTPYRSFALDLETNEWEEDVTSRPSQLHEFASMSPPLFYNGVWYIYDGRHRVLRGFDFNQLFWFTVPGLEKIFSPKSFLFYNGDDDDFSLVSSLPNPDFPTSSIFYQKFKIKKTVDGLTHAVDVFKSPTRTVNGSEFLLCFTIPLHLPPVTEVRSSVANVTHRDRARATNTGLLSSAQSTLQDSSETDGTSEWQTVRGRKNKKRRDPFVNRRARQEA